MCVAAAYHTPADSMAYHRTPQHNIAKHSIASHSPQQHMEKEDLPQLETSDSGTKPCKTRQGSHSRHPSLRPPAGQGVTVPVPAQHTAAQQLIEAMIMLSVPEGHGWCDCTSAWRSILLLNNLLAQGHDHATCARGPQVLQLCCRSLPHIKGFLGTCEREQGLIACKCLLTDQLFHNHWF